MCLGEPGLVDAGQKLEAQSCRMLIVGEVDQRRGCCQTQRLASFHAEVHVMLTTTLRLNSTVQLTAVCRHT